MRILVSTSYPAFRTTQRVARRLLGAALALMLLPTQQATAQFEAALAVPGATAAARQAAQQALNKLANTPKEKE